MSDICWCNKKKKRHRKLFIVIFLSTEQKKSLLISLLANKFLTHPNKCASALAQGLFFLTNYMYNIQNLYYLSADASMQQFFWGGLEKLPPCLLCVYRRLLLSDCASAFIPVCRVIKERQGDTSAEHRCPLTAAWCLLPVQSAVLLSIGRSRNTWHVQP